MKEKNKKIYNSLLIIVISILVCLYLAKYVGWLMDTLGGYEHEGDCPNRNDGIIVFLHVLPAFIIQLLNFIHFKKCYKLKEVSFRLLTELIVVFTLLYTIYMFSFSIAGACGWWIYFIIIPLIPVLLIGYLIFKLIKFLMNKKENHE